MTDVHLTERSGEAVQRLLPSPSVYRDAERYRFLREHPDWLGWDEDYRADEIDREVDKQMAIVALGNERKSEAAVQNVAEALGQMEQK